MEKPINENQTDLYEPNDKSTPEFSLSVFQTHIDTINVEKQLIWMRYSAMLIVNSIVFGVLGSSDFGGLLGFGASIFGLLLSLSWYKLTSSGFKIQDMRIKEADSFFLKDNPNPARIVLKYLERKRNEELSKLDELPKWIRPLKKAKIKYDTTEWIRVSAIATILLFVAIYIISIFYCWLDP